MSIENFLDQSEKEPLKDPIVEEFLCDIYKPEKIFAQKIEQKNEGEVSVTFVFPEYERTIRPIDHVSMAQMHEAVMEGLYCAIGHAIRNKYIDAPINYNHFQENKMNSIYFRENFSFRRMLKANEPSELTFKIIKVEEKKIRRSFYSITVQVKGFIKGEVECLLEKEVQD